MSDTEPLLVQALEPEEATKRIRRMTRKGVDLSWTEDVKEAIKERGLVMGDLHHVLRKGIVLTAGVPCTRQGFFKYVIESRTPNFIGQNLKLMVIIGNGDGIKVCEVMP